MPAAKSSWAITLRLDRNREVSRRRGGAPGAAAVEECRSLKEETPRNAIKRGILVQLIKLLGAAVVSAIVAHALF
jgi:hypothetical protein